MHYHELAQRIVDQVRGELTLQRRMGLFALPVLLLPLMALVGQAVRGGWSLVAGLMGAGVLLAQCDLLTRPAQGRVQRTISDAAPYLPLPPPVPSLAWRRLALDAPLALPALLSALVGLALFLPALLGQASAWQRVAGVALGIGLGLWFCWQLLRGVALLRHLLTHYTAQLERYNGTNTVRGKLSDGLLNPALLSRLDACVLPAMRLSPAARALLRLEGYLLLRDNPAVTAPELREALQAWATQANADEQRHWLLPAVGGKIYLRCSANGVVAEALSATARRLGLDGAYSGTLRTWLVRLPPARSYAVQARLIDAVAALGILPRQTVLIHHLTVAGDLGRESPVPALLHLLSTPLLFEERPGAARGDERPFIMSGGGVMDDLDRGVRGTGARTDFVDGFLMLDVPELQAVEHLTGHTINLRLKQLLAWAIALMYRAPERLTPAERRAVARYELLYAELEHLLARYKLEGALGIQWLDGRWSEQWPYMRAISEAKQRDAAFLPAAQQLRDDALDDLERLTSGKLPTSNK